MSESKLPNLIIGLTVDSTGIDAGLNRAKSKISRFGGGSGGGVNSGVNNGTGGWGAGGGNDIGGAVLGAALGAGVSRGGGTVSQFVNQRQLSVARNAFSKMGKTDARLGQMGTLLGRGISENSKRRVREVHNSVVGFQHIYSNDLGDLARNENNRSRDNSRANELNMRASNIIDKNRQNYYSRKYGGGISKGIEKLRQGIEGSFVGRTATALGMSAKLGPLAVAGTAYAIGSKIANYKRDEIARTSDLTRFKGTADYGKYQQMKYDYISKPRIEDQRSMGASAVSKGGAGAQTATDKLMDAGATTLGAMGYVAGAAFENFSQLFYQPSDNIKVALDIIDRRKNSI